MLCVSGMAYERQISPTSIDELAALNCNVALGFVELTATSMPPNENNGQGKDPGSYTLLSSCGNILIAEFQNKCYSF